MSKASFKGMGSHRVGGFSCLDTENTQYRVVTPQTEALRAKLRIPLSTRNVGYKLEDREFHCNPSSLHHQQNTIHWRTNWWACGRALKVWISLLIRWGKVFKYPYLYREWIANLLPTPVLKCWRCPQRADSEMKMILSWGGLEPNPVL